MSKKKLEKAMTDLRAIVQENRERLQFDAGMIVTNAEEIGRLDERTQIMYAYTEMDGETFQSWLYLRCGVGL